jgi:hypothetical protein
MNVYSCPRRTMLVAVLHGCTDLPLFRRIAESRESTIDRLTSLDALSAASVSMANASRPQPLLAVR